MHKSDAALRQFIARFAHGEQIRELPSALRRIALGALRGTPYANDLGSADDLVQDLVESLLVATKADNARSARKLLELPDRKLAGALRWRARQLAVEKFPGWKPFRELARHVREALRSPGEPPTCPPPALLVHDRFSRDCVRAATAWALSLEDGPERDERAITSFLLERYFATKKVPLGELEFAAAGADPERLVAAAHDGRVAARRLERMAGTEPARALAGRLAGRPLRELGPVATVSDRIKRALSVAKSLALRHDREALACALLSSA